MPKKCMHLEMSPLENGRDWELTHDYIRLVKGRYIKVPKGFVTDMASVPRFFWRLVPPWGRHGRAAIIHDYFYRNRDEEVSRGYADRIMRDLMKEDGTCFIERWTIYYLLRLFAGFAFQKRTNIRLR